MIDSKLKLVSIKQFATLCRTTPRTIRFYDQKGLIRPAKIDPVTNYRYYDPYQAREYFKIKLLHNFHIPLRQIGSVIKKANKETFLDAQLATIKKEIEEKVKELTFLKNIRSFLFSGKPANLHLKSEVWGPFVVFGTTDQYGRYDKINSVMVELFKRAKELKIPVTENQMTFYLDPVDYRPKDTNLMICLICKLKTIPEDIKLPDGYFFSEYPKTDVKAYNYKGPYDYITLIYQKLYEGRVGLLQPHEVGFDMHVYGSWNKKSPYDYLTKIAFKA